MKDLVSMTHPLKTALRDLALKLVMAVPPLRKWAQEGGFKPNPIYTKGQYLGLPRRRSHGPEGALAPQPVVRSLDGRCLLLDEVLGEGIALVGLGVDPRTGLSATTLQLLADLDARQVTLFPYGGRPQGLRGVARSTAPGLSEVEDMNGDMVAWFARAGFKSNAVAILRPDKFAFAVVSPAELEPALEQLRSQLCWARRPLPLSKAA